MENGFLPIATYKTDLVVKELQEKIKTYIESIENIYFQHFALLILIISLKKPKFLIEQFLLDKVYNQNSKS